MILFLELLASLLIAAGIFLLSVPLGLISVGVLILVFALAWERARGKAE